MRQGSSNGGFLHDWNSVNVVHCLSFPPHLQRPKAVQLKYVVNISYRTIAVWIAFG